MMGRKLNIAEPYLTDREWHATREVFESGWLTQGAQVAAFERMFAARHTAPYGIATTSCTTALQLALEARGIGPGDEVIVPAFTWVATANAVRYVGADPVFVDVDPSTYNLAIDALAPAVTDLTRAIIPVHLFGLCVDVAAVREVVPPGTFILEDAACAAGAVINGTSAGALGDAAAFSFHPRKIITTGEGGMVLTADETLAARASRLRNHGASVPEEVRHNGPQPYILPDFEELGFNLRMTDLQAAVGRVQLERLDELVKVRRQMAAVYTERLGSISWLVPPHVPEGVEHSWQSYVCTMAPDAASERNEIMSRLERGGVSTRPGTHAPPLLGLYRDSVTAPEEAFPNAAQLAAETIALPLHNRMSCADVEFLFERLEEI